MLDSMKLSIEFLDLEFDGWNNEKFLSLHT